MNEMETKLEALKISRDINGLTGYKEVDKIVSDAKVIAEYLTGTEKPKTQNEGVKGDKQLLQE